MTSRKKLSPGKSLAVPVPRRGEVWLANKNPIIPNDPHLSRPVVVISTDPRNRALGSIIVVPFTTRLHDPFPPLHKLVPAGEGGLPKTSYARCELVSHIQKTCLNPAGPLGERLAQKYMWEIARGVRAAIGDNPLV